MSDGGHFENLGLYELIRRRCRYIIVSDASADPNVKLEDFGNAVRRIREDFDADIEIDLGPLLPDKSGVSHQHVAVGTIRYDATGDDFDVGILVYFKPTLTGDEPVDLLNYRALNPSFPHETTGDQFYDEAEWESYRSLGFHSAFTAFSFLDGCEVETSERKGIPIARVFTQARDKWYPTPPDFGSTLITLNERCLALEKRLSTEAPLELIREIYPELERVEGQWPHATTAVAAAADMAQQNARCVHLVIEIMQLIEDVWLTADFDRNYNHPLMIGWINAFNRWTRTTIVRRWWPFLIPLYTPGMRKFAEEHFSVPKLFGGESPLQVRFHPVASNAELYRFGISPDNRPRSSSEVVKFWRLEVRIPETPAPEHGASDDSSWTAVGAMRFSYVQASGTVKWFDKDFEIRPGMWNTGLGCRFMLELVKGRLPDLCPLRMLQVTLNLNEGESHARRGTGHRRERNDLIFFYKSLGFKQLVERQNCILLGLTIPQVSDDI